MQLEGPARDLVGSDLEFPEFDPWGFTKNADEEKMAWWGNTSTSIDVCTDCPFLHWSVDKVSFESSFYFRYRAAELKHGRIAMLAALGQITQYYVRLGDPVFNQVTTLGTSKRILLTIHCFCQRYSLTRDELHTLYLLRATSLLRHTSRSSRRGLSLLYKFFLQFSL